MKGKSMQLPGARTPISPKVLSGANWSGYATLILTVLGFITPDMLTGLGHYAPLVYGVVVGVTYAIGAYLKTDPARDAGLAAAAQAQSGAAVPDVPVTSTVVINTPVTTDPDPTLADPPAAPAVTN